MNPVEKLANFAFKNPTVHLASVRRVELARRPGRVRAGVDFGFAGNTAPAAGLITAHSRGRYAGGRAAVFVYFGRRALRVELDDHVWRLFLVSAKDAEQGAEELAEAVRRHAETRG